MKRLIKAAIAGILTLAGCNDFPDFLKADSYSVGMNVRRVKGRWKAFHVGKEVPYFRIQGNKKLDENLDIYLRGDFTSREFQERSYSVDVDIRGDMQSLGTGISFYPFKQRELSLDAGVEAFHANVTAIGEKFNFSARVEDSVYGYGANVGVSYNHKIKDNLSFVASGGYNFTDTSTERTAFDFDGPYGFVGLKLTLP